MVQTNRSELGFLVLFFGFLVISNRVEGKNGGGDEIDRRLRLLNKPAVKSIQSEDGDIIDCVDIYKQPAFDHPALKNHTIQMRPSFAKSDSPNKTNGSYDRTMIMSQRWHKSGTCPNGTIPIRRIRRADLLRFDSLERFGKKPESLIDTKVPRYVTFENGTRSKIGAFENRSSASLVTVGYNYLGAKADLNIWNPTVELESEFTTGQIWLKAGPGDNFESVESGWMVNPSLYGDRQSRFFGFWTGDAYKSKGCFDLTCPGFVQVSTKFGLGAAVSPLSSSDGDQYFITIQIQLDTATGNWWLRYGDTDIGYWPVTLFGSLSHSSILVEWGGEVFSQNVMKAPHTKTAMGSGDFASGLWGHACFVRYPRIMGYSRDWKYPDWLGVATNEPYCYSVLNFRERYGTEPVFYYGGPGGMYNCNCP